MLLSFKSTSNPIRLTITCRDNLEFLQWIKRFWDQNYGGHEYDAVARRKGAPMEPPATIAPLTAARSGSSSGEYSLFPLPLFLYSRFCSTSFSSRANTN